jgi:transmembrane 9 superfamily member 1
MNIQFTYSVKWVSTDKQFHQRLEKYIESTMFPEEIEIQWFSIVNSLILVFLLTCFLMIIVIRILKKDFDRFSIEEIEESGWKRIHADVFRNPDHITLISAILGKVKFKTGNGAQLIGLSVCILILALLGFYYPDYSYRTMYSSLIVVYCLTTSISGFVSEKYYKQFGGKI